MRKLRSRLSNSLLALTAAGFAFAIAVTSQLNAQRSLAGNAGPANQGMPLPQQAGDLREGRDVLRFETFGNEGFWTDAVRLPQGIAAAGVTPLQALQLGLQVDSDMVDPTTKAQLARELAADPSGRSSRLLNDPAVTAKLVMAGAIIGMAPKGMKVGATCALCHTMTDASVMRVSEGGSIGSRVDGLANHNLQVGKIFAAAANTRALF